ncbi:phospholipase-like protein [Tanacetum coccineum]
MGAVSGVDFRWFELGPVRVVGGVVGGSCTAGLVGIVGGIISVIFMGHEFGIGDDVFLRMVEDLDVWNDFPWERHMWRELYGAIRNAKKPNCDLYPNKCEAQSEWFKRSTDFFKMYTPRAPPVEYGGLFGAYLKKLSLARTRREKDGDAESGCQTSTKEVSLKDRVKAMEGLCTSLMILPKEIKSLKARVYKLETIINVITKKESNLKHKIVNFGDLGDKYWSDKDGEFFSFNVSPHQSANKDPVNELVDALDDLVDENGVVEVEKDLFEDDGLKVQKLEAENKRLAEQRRIRYGFRLKSDVERIWILESSCATGRWWYKCSEAIPSGSSWSSHFPLQFGEYGLIFLRAPPVEYGGLFGSYLKKLSLAKTLREKGGDADPVCQTSAKDVSLKDRVKAMEGLCTSLMILPKEIKSLKARVYKLETIINVITKKQKRSDLKEKDKLNSVDKQCDIGEKFWSDEDGELLSFTVSPKQSAKKNAINELVDALDDLVDENVLVEAETDLSQDDGLKNQKLEAENKRLAEQRRPRFHKMKEEENSMKSGLLSNSTHMKLALEKCGTNKRRYVNVLRPPLEEDTYVKVLSIDRLKKQNNVLDEEMIEKCQQLKQWDEEDLNRPFKCIDKVYCNFLLEQFLVTSSWCKFRFPWCNDIIVDRRFWDSLIGLDDKRLGWLLDDHIELWVWYMWHFRQTCHDWSIVSCYFLTLLLQDSMPYFYVTDEIYPISWKDVEQVFIPINEPTRHWSLALFHISSGSVTFYDSQKIYDVEYRPWYLKMRSCLETKLPVILQRTGVFASKGIDPNSYSIKFSHAENVPQQGGVFGDCGVFLCLFLYRLANGIPLAVEDPIQMALAYREKLVKFYFEHKIIYES